jgi:aminotransferase
MKILERGRVRVLRAQGRVLHHDRHLGFGFPDDVAFARHLVTDVGVASVPGSSFYRDPDAGRQCVRFCFCKKEETLLAAEQRLGRLAIAGLRK